MTDDNYKVQVSLSLPPAAQYAKGDMINFRGETPEEVRALLDAAIGEDGLIIKAVEAAKVYLLESGLGQQSSGSVGGVPDNVVPFTGNTAPAAAPAASGPPAPMCQHGKRTWKDGGTWRAWFCPTPKGSPDQCPPIWANKDGSPKD